MRVDGNEVVMRYELLVFEIPGWRSIKGLDDFLIYTTS